MVLDVIHKLQHMRYENALLRLYNMNRQIPFKYNLDNVRRISQYMGDPHKKVKVVHVTGTNGKGSVCYKLSQILQDNKMKTGLFISPHLTTFRERIQVDSEMISKNFITNFLDQIYDKIEKGELRGSFFEILTVLAFQYFKEKEVDIACIEVGIGGRLDATNIIDSNLLSIITNIGQDHSDLLGNSQEEILIEKMHIIKKGCPVLVGSQIKNSWIVENFAKEMNSDYFQ